MFGGKNEEMIVLTTCLLTPISLLPKPEFRVPGCHFFYCLCDYVTKNEQHIVILSVYNFFYTKKCHNAAAGDNDFSTFLKSIIFYSTITYLEKKSNAILDLVLIQFAFVKKNFLGQPQNIMQSQVKKKT